MSAKSVCLAAVIIFALAVWVVSFATKGAHLKVVYDRIEDLREDSHTNQVYPAMEGVIAMDCILFGLEFIGLVLACKPNGRCGKITGFLIFLALLARIILGIIFLAGNDERGRRSTQHYYDDNLGKLSDEEMKYIGAWIFEIIALILGVPLSIIAIPLMAKSG